MAENKHMYLRKVRNLTSIVKDSFQYLSDHARTLLFTLSAFALPFNLLAISVAQFFSGRNHTFDNIFYLKNSLSKESFLIVIVSFIVFIISMCVQCFIINKHLVMQDPETAHATEPTFDSLKKGLGEGIRNSFFNFLIVFVIYFAASHLLTYFFGNNSAVAGYTMFPESAIDYVVRFVLLIGPTLLAMPFIFYFCFAALFVSYRDNIGSSDALVKVWQISQGHLKKIWMGGFICVLISYIALYMIQFTFYLLQTFLYSFSTFSGNMFFVLYLAETITTFFILPYIHISCVILFGSIEDEKEGHYIKRKIDQV